MPILDGPRWTHASRPFRLTQVNVAENGISDKCTAKDRPAEVRPAEVRPDESRNAEVRPAEVRPAEVRPAEVRPAEVRHAEVRPVEVRPTEVRPAEVEIYVGMYFSPFVPGLSAIFQYRDVF